MTGRKKLIWILVVIFAGALAVSVIFFHQRQEEEPGGTLVSTEMR